MKHRFIHLLVLAVSLFSSNLSPDAIALINGANLSTGNVSVAQSRSATTTVTGMLLVDGAFDEPAFLALGGDIFTRSPEVLTVSIPLGAIERLTEVEGILQFSPSRKLTQKLNKALEWGSAKNVYVGTGNLDQSYTGEGVVVGIIDLGFDYSHIMFRDKNDGSHRISRIWDQTKRGTPPSGYNYGHMMSTEEEMLRDPLCSNWQTSHGSHVAGIAAGSKVYLDDTLQGVAPGAEIVLVSCNLVDNGIVDGMRWIFSYADSIGKPAVINLSLGSHYGPHDGSSVVDRVIEAFTGEGRIVVGAAGNERSARVHIGKNINGDTLKSFVTISEDPQMESGVGTQYLNIWGEAGQNFSVGIGLYRNGQRVTPQLYSVGDIVKKNVVSKSFTSSDGYPVEVYMFGNETSPLNGKPEVVVQIITSSPAIQAHSEHISVHISGERGEVHAWTLRNSQADTTDFYGNDQLGMVHGDSTYSVGEVGGTGESTISVGSITSKTEFQNWGGGTYYAHGYTEGVAAPYSSMGPTSDKRLKPEIAAPGDILISALRSDYIDNGNSTDNIYTREGSYLFGGYSGTSMASPFVTGAVALMLEADPTLTPQKIKDILRASAVKDSYEDSLSYGTGLINVDSALVLVEEQSVGSSRADLGKKIFLTTNAAGDLQLSVTSETVQNVTVKLYDFRGRELVSQVAKVQNGVSAIPTSKLGLAPGSYIYKISGKEIHTTGKMLFMK